MGENYPGEISIGGEISETILLELFNVLEEWGLGYDLNEGPAVFSSVKDIRLDAEGHFSLCDSTASYGMFEELETFLKDKNLPYNRWSSSCVGYDAELSYFRPGYDVVNESVTSNYDRYITRAELGKMVSELEEITTEGVTGWIRVKGIIQKLKDMSKDLSELPRFIVV